MQELSVITVNGIEYSIKDEIARQTVSANGIIHSPNADYAEIGEWADGNPGNENRVGYFVCVDKTTAGITMTKAKADSDVRGVTMLHPGFSGNAGPDKFDSKGELLPQYNYVGFVGFIPVIDNGRCRINDRCMPSDDGTAVPSSNNLGYQVIDRVDSNRVLILVEPQADMIQRIKVDMDRVSEDNVISVEGVQTDIDATDDAIADILLSKCDSPVYSRSISQGAYSTSTGQIFETTNCCCSTIYAYTDSRTFICANGYKVQMLFYGSATGAGNGKASAYTGTYTGWSRICTIPALTYVALNFRREDNGLIVPDDLTGNYFRLMSEHVITIDEKSTDTQYPSAKAVYDAINTYSVAPIEQLTEDKDATDSSLADVLIGSGYLAPHNKSLQQGTFSRTDGRKLSSANADYYKRVRTTKLYAYGNATTFVCDEGYKMRMYYYGVATVVGDKEDTTTYTGKYTGWSRVITSPPMEYVAFVIKADDDREITAADVTDKIYKYVPPTIPEAVTDSHIKSVAETESIKSALADKADRSEIPDVPVTDVQLGGKSLLKDGVATIPVASSGLGAVWISGGGLKINSSTGWLYLMVASQTDINNRSNYYPIAGSNLDIAVKAAMTDGKGAAWTEAEQLAAQARLGIISSEGVGF